MEEEFATKREFAERQVRHMCTKEGWMSQGLDVQVQAVNLAARTLTCRMRVTPAVCNGLGSLHGGAASSLVDELTTIAMMMFDKELRASVSVTLHTEYCTAAPRDTIVDIESKCIKVGKTLAYLSCEIRNAATGKVHVVGTHVKYLMPMPKL